MTELTKDEIAGAELCESMEHRPPHGEVHSRPCCIRTGDGEDSFRCTSVDQILYAAKKLSDPISKVTAV